MGAMSARARARAAQRTPTQEDLGCGMAVRACQRLDEDLHGGSARLRPARRSVGDTVGPPGARVAGSNVGARAAA